jgi:hypothetical protein
MPFDLLLQMLLQIDPGTGVAKTILAASAIIKGKKAELSFLQPTTSHDIRHFV